MSYEELKAIADSVGELHGWDFSRMRTDRDPMPWDYAEIVRGYLRPTDHVLDIATGGRPSSTAWASTSIQRECSRRRRISRLPGMTASLFR